MNNYYENLNKEDNQNIENKQFLNRKQKISKNDINYQHNYLREKKKKFQRGERLLSNNYIKSLKNCYNYLKFQENPKQQRRKRKKNLIKNFIYRKHDFAYDLTKKNSLNSKDLKQCPIEFSDTQSDSCSEYSSSDSSRVIEVLPRKKPMEILSLSEVSQRPSIQQSLRSIQIIQEKPIQEKQLSAKKSIKDSEKNQKLKKKVIQSPKQSKKLIQVSPPRIKNSEKQQKIKTTNKTKVSNKQQDSPQQIYIESQDEQQDRNHHVRELDQVIRSLSVIFEIDQTKLNSMIEKYNGDMEKK